MVLIISTACVRNQPEIVIITATFPTNNDGVAPDLSLMPTDIADQGEQNVALPQLELSPIPSDLSIPTPDTLVASLAGIPSEHVVQAGDTLSLIAQRYGLSLDSVLTFNEIINPDILQVGQIIYLPDLPQQQSPNFKIIADSRLVRATSNFDIEGFMTQQPGYIRNFTEEVSRSLSNGSQLLETLTASQIIRRVSLEYSVDPRLLIAILEYRAGWLSQNSIQPPQLTYPFAILPGREGLYRQLAWLANELNRGYYGWKYQGFNRIELIDGTRFAFSTTLNPASIAVQYVLSLYNTTSNWQFDVSEQGLFTTYYAYFGNPFENRIDSPVPSALVQPQFELPFAENEVWYFTGGAHGGWGGGSAWAAIDFAPPDERNNTMPLCYTSQYPVRAVAPGIIARSGDGMVILDLDGDGDEATGWTVLYLHLDSSTLIPEGQQVVTGTPLGNPSCEGGFSNATHLHIARRYNGEWIPVDCTNCLSGLEPPPLQMSGWQTVAISGQEYQGFLIRDNIQKQAEQGRETLINQVSR